MKTRHYVVYFGRIIWRNPTPGYGLRWNCEGVGAADTLAGMKQLVRAQL